MTRKSDKESIEIISNNAIVEGDVHYGTYVRADAGHADEAVRGVALCEKLSEEISSKYAGTTSSIKLKENNKHVMGNQTIGFTLEITDIKKDKKVLPLSPDSPLVSSAKSNREYFAIVKEESNYRVDIGYAAFNHTEAETVVGVIEQFIEGKGQHCFVKASCVRKPNGDIKSLKFDEEAAAIKLIQLLNRGLAEIPVSQRFGK